MNIPWIKLLNYRFKWLIKEPRLFPLMSILYGWNAIGDFSFDWKPNVRYLINYEIMKYIKCIRRKTVEEGQVSGVRYYAMNCTVGWSGSKRVTGIDKPIGAYLCCDVTHGILGRSLRSSHLNTGNGISCWRLDHIMIFVVQNKSLYIFPPGLSNCSLNSCTLPPSIQHLVVKRQPKYICFKLSVTSLAAQLVFPAALHLQSCGYKSCVPCLYMEFSCSLFVTSVSSWYSYSFSKPNT